MFRKPSIVHRVALPLLAVLFVLSSVGKGRTSSEGGSYWIGALSWAAFGVLLVAVVLFTLVVLVTRFRGARG